MDAPERNRLLLSRLVPLEILDLKASDPRDVASLRPEAQHLLLHRGAELARIGRPWYTEEANSLARAVAVLSFSPEGAEFMGLRFRSTITPDASAVAVSVPRFLTFEAGTLGRLVLSRGLRMHSTEIESNPLIGGNPWGGKARHHLVRLTDRQGNTFTTHYSHGVDAGSRGIETVLLALGGDAADAERYAGDVVQYARELDLDPEDPDTVMGLRHLEAQARELREFLGEGYEQLLAIVEPGRAHA